MTSPAAVTAVTAAATGVYDVLICGGGIVGSTLACALASNTAVGRTTQKLRVGLVEPSPPRSLAEVAARKHPGLRVSALSPRSVNIFKEIGAWTHMEALGVQPYTSMKVWDHGGDGCIEWFGDEEQRRSVAEHGSGDDDDVDDAGVLGFVVENDVITSSLYHSFTQYANHQSNGGEEHTNKFTVFPGAKVVAIDNIITDDTTHNDDGESLFQAIPPTQPPSPPPPLSPSTATTTSNTTVYEEDDDLLRVRLDNGSVVRARLVVGADGPNSLVKQGAKLSSFGWNYHQRGVVATVMMMTNDDRAANTTVAWQRFLPDGPLALLPLHDQRYASIVWSTTSAHAHHLQRQETADFVAELNRAFRADYTPPDQRFHLLPHDLRTVLPTLLQPRRLPAHPPMITGVAEAPKSFPLRFSHTARYTRHRVALIGDTAHTIHPMAGQGANLGIADAHCLYSVVVDAVLNGEDVGFVSVMERYEQRRKYANIGVMMGVDMLQSVFGLHASPLRTLRNIGIDVVNNVPPLKSLAAKVAKGNLF